MDDHSTDESLKIAKHFKHKDQRIILLGNCGNGINDALNTAYKKSSGAYITRMDADDIMPKQKLECLIEALHKNGAGHVSTGLVSYFPKECINDGYQKYQDWLNRLTRNNTHFDEIYKECVIASPCWMMHRKDFETIGGFSSKVYPEDYDLVFRMYKHHLNVIGIKEVLHFWRDYPSRTSRTHPNYADNRFLELKMDYFLSLDLDQNKNTILWGAGKKGKYIAKRLTESAIDFTWVCDNPKKIGKEIYGVDLQYFKDIVVSKKQQHLISIAVKSAQEFIKQYIDNKALKIYYFC